MLPGQYRANWVQAAEQSSRRKAITQGTVHHNGRPIKIDIVMSLETGNPEILWRDVALEVRGLKLTAKEIDNPSLVWRPY